MAIRTLQAAMTALNLKAQPNVVPLLGDEELQALLANAQIATVYAASTAYAYGDQVVVLTNGRYYKAIVGGTSNTTAPSWPTNSQAKRGHVLTDNDIQWQDAGEAYPDLWDIRAAARAAWLLKAQKASEEVSTNDGLVKVEYEQIYDHCMRQAKTFVPLVF